MTHIIDTHIHLQDFNPDFTPLLLNSPMVKTLVLASASAKDFPLISKLYNTSPQKIIPAFGFHPWQANSPYDLESLKSYLFSTPTSIIGEIGLDGIKTPPTPNQHQLFSAQLDIAINSKKSVIIHGAKAFNQLSSYAPKLSLIKYTFHSFTPNSELLKFLIKTNAYIGLGKTFINHKNSSSMATLLPLDKILFETDAPYQLEEQNYLDNAQTNLQKLSKLLKLTTQELQTILEKNTMEFTKC